MTRAEALAVAGLWRAWSASRKIDNRARREFVFKVIGARARLKHLDRFEVLDAITNEAAWRDFGSAGSGAAGAEPGQAPEHGAGSEPGAAGIVEVEETPH